MTLEEKESKMCFVEFHAFTFSVDQNECDFVLWIKVYKNDVTDDFLFFFQQNLVWSMNLINTQIMNNNDCCMFLTF